MSSDPFLHEMNNLHQQEMLQQAAQIRQARTASQARTPYNHRIYRAVLLRLGELLTEWGNELQVRYGDLTEMELAHQTDIPGFVPNSDCY